MNNDKIKNRAIVPLAKHVPVWVLLGRKWRLALVNEAIRDGRVTLFGKPGSFAADRIRVALEEPQGFGFALRAVAGSLASPAWDGRVTGRWLEGLTTDADHDAMDEALRQLVAS